MTGFEQFCAVTAGIFGAVVVLVGWADAWRERGSSAPAQADDDGE